MTGERVYIIMRRVWMFACVCFVFMKGLVLRSDWRKSLHHYEKSLDVCVCMFYVHEGTGFVE